MRYITDLHHGKPCSLSPVHVHQVNENIMLSRQTSSLMRAMDAFNESIMLVDTDAETWTIMFINDAWIRMLGAWLFSG